MRGAPDHTMESTSALLDRCRHGDATALDALLRHCLPPLLRWAKGRLPRRARGMNDTMDMVQDAVIKSLRHLHTFEPRRGSSLHAYLRRAVLNRVRDECRVGARRPTAQDGQYDTSVALGPSPLDEAIGRENVARYERALGALDEEERQVIIARLEWGYSYQEMAEALNRPSPEAARQALRRAVTRLAREMSRDA